MNNWYILDEERHPVRIGNIEDLAKAQRRQKDAGLWQVARETVAPGVDVSTVFLFLDHRSGDGPPLLFESMVFACGYPFDNECERCSTWVEAEEQHANMVVWVKGQIGAQP